MLYCHLLRNILFYANLLAVEAYSVRTGTYVAVIGIRHFAWTIHDTAHDTYLQTLEMLSCLLDLGDGFTKIVEGSAASRTTDILCLAGAQTGCLKYSESGFIYCLGRDVSIVHQPDTIGQTINHQGSHISSSLQLEVALLLLAVLVHLGKDHRVLQAGIHHLVNQCTLVAQAVLMIAYADNHHLRMSLQTGDIFLGRCTILQGEELHVCLDAGDERHCHGRENRVEFGTSRLWLAVQRLVNVVIYDVALASHKLLRHLATDVDIIWSSILVLTSGALAVDSVADNHRNVAAADIAYSHGFAAGRAQPVE